MEGDIDVWMPLVVCGAGIRCVLINPDSFVKEYIWSGEDVEELTDALQTSCYMRTPNLRQKTVKGFTVLYDRTEYNAEESASIFIDDNPVCYGPCIIFGKDITPLTEDNVLEFCMARYLYTYDGSTSVCVKLKG